MSSLSDLIFPNQDPTTTNTNNINKILGDLKRSNLSITNRLRSILEDADFVEHVAAATTAGASPTRRPLVANERCGSWYIRPGLKAASAYFKSTDGHTGQWKFSARRLNLHLLPVIEEHDGIIIVDSTRRGKRMPDSLSKTVPIWCCVLNRVLFPDQPEHHGLYVPPNVVSDSEKSQMLARVPTFVASFRELNLDLASLRGQITKPLRPTWMTQETLYMGRLEEDLGLDPSPDDPAAPTGLIFDAFRPVVCCTSSRRITDGEMSGHSGYVQGAGDDTENWALGLTPPVFWANADALLCAPEADLPDLIRSLVAADAAAGRYEQQHDGGGGVDGGLPSTVGRLTPYIYVCPLPLPLPRCLPAIDGDGDDGAEVEWCRIALSSSATPPEMWTKSPDHMDVGLGRHKAASRNLRAALPSICSFVSRFLEDKHNDCDNNNYNEGQEATGQTPQKKKKRIIIADESGGKDLSIGVALALICCCFSDEEGHVPRETGGAGGDGDGAGAGVGVGELSFNKTMIKVRLGRIMTTMPDANPNRATLQSVNSFLMDWR